MGHRLLYCTCILYTAHISNAISAVASHIHSLFKNVQSLRVFVQVCVYRHLIIYKPIYCRLGQLNNIMTSFYDAFKSLARVAEIIGCGRRAGKQGFLGWTPKSITHRMYSGDHLFI